MTSRKVSVILRALISYNNEGARFLEAGNYADALSRLSTGLEKSKIALDLFTRNGADQATSNMSPSGLTPVVSIQYGIDEDHEDTYYRNPIFLVAEFPDDEECFLHMAEDVSRICTAAIIFNIAQAHFLRSLKRGCPELEMRVLMKCARLYDCGIKVICEVEGAADMGQDCVYYMCCAWNNLVYIYRRLGYGSKSNALSLQLLRTAMFISQDNEEETSPLVHFFLGNMMSSLFEPHQQRIAPAA